MEDANLRTTVINTMKFIYRVYQKKGDFRNQAYCKNLNAFSIAHMLNRGG
jgi:hypothetical protein